VDLLLHGGDMVEQAEPSLIADAAAA